MISKRQNYKIGISNLRHDLLNEAMADHLEGEITNKITDRVWKNIARRIDDQLLFLTKRAIKDCYEI